MFWGQEELEEFFRRRDRFSLAFGVHHPLRMDLGKDKNCSLCHPDPQRRRQGLDQLERTLLASREIGAEYVVAHAPETRAIWHEAGIPSEEGIRALAVLGGEELADLAASCGVPIYLEQAAPHPYFTQGSDFVKTVEGHPELGLCIDLHRLGLTSVTMGTDPHCFIAQTAPWIRTVHLNACGPVSLTDGPPVFPGFELCFDRRGYRKAWSDSTRRAPKKAPVHPDQDPEEGWLNSAALIEGILGVNRDITLVHEYYHRVYPMGYFLEGHAWISELISRLGGSDGPT